MKHLRSTFTERSSETYFSRCSFDLSLSFRDERSCNNKYKTRSRNVLTIRYQNQVRDNKYANWINTKTACERFNNNTIFIATYAVAKKVWKKKSGFNEIQCDTGIAMVMGSNVIVSPDKNGASRQRLETCDSVWPLLRPGKQFRSFQTILQISRKSTKRQVNKNIQSYLASLTVSSFVTVAMSSFPVTPFTVTITITLFTRRPVAVTIPKW